MYKTSTARTRAVTAVLAAVLGLFLTTLAGTANAAGTGMVTADAPAVSQGGPPAGTWWGVRNGKTITSYNQYIPGYRYGCNGDQRHKGIDVGAPTGTLTYAWGNGRVVGSGYDTYGYHRWMQVYFPSVNMSLTLGHLRNGSQLAVGTRFSGGQAWARVGTKQDAGGTTPHVHFRAARGNHGAYPISPCEDMNPYIVWHALGLPG